MSSSEPDDEQLTIEVSSYGTIDPEDALKEAANILVKHLWLFTDEKIMPVAEDAQEDPVDENYLAMRKVLKTPLTDLDLSVRAFNCLKAAEVKTLGDLVS